MFLGTTWRNENDYIYKLKLKLIVPLAGLKLESRIRNMDTNPFNCFRKRCNMDYFSNCSDLQKIIFILLSMRVWKLKKCIISKRVWRQEREYESEIIMCKKYYSYCFSWQWRRSLQMRRTLIGHVSVKKKNTQTQLVESRKDVRENGVPVLKCLSKVWGFYIFVIFRHTWEVHGTDVIPRIRLTVKIHSYR